MPVQIDDKGLLNLKKMENWDNIDVICIDEALFFYNPRDFIISIERRIKYYCSGIGWHRIENHWGW